MNNDPQKRNCPPTTACAVIIQSLKYYYQNCLSLIALSAVVIGPFMLLTRYLLNYAWNPLILKSFCQDFGFLAGVLFGVFLMLTLPFFVIRIGSAIFTATIIPNILGYKEKRENSFLRNIPGTFRRLGSLIIVSFFSATAISFGGICLVLPGLFLMVVFSIAIPVLVIEKTGPIQAMKKSWAYTTGKRGKIFLVLLGIAIIQKIVKYVFMKIGSVIFTLAIGDHYPSELSIIPSLFGSIVASPIIYVSTVFLYLYVKNRNPEPVVSENSVQDVE